MINKEGRLKLRPVHLRKNQGDPEAYRKALEAKQKRIVEAHQQVMDSFNKLVEHLDGMDQKYSGRTGMEELARKQEERIEREWVAYELERRKRLEYAKRMIEDDMEKEKVLKHLELGRDEYEEYERNTVDKRSPN